MIAGYQALINLKPENNEGYLRKIDKLQGENSSNPAPEIIAMWTEDPSSVPVQKQSKPTIKRPHTPLHERSLSR
jgi:hypothetical protein